MHTIDILLVEGFPLLSLSLVTEPLRLANRERLEQVFNWRLLSLDGQSVRSSSGLALSVDGTLDDAPADAVLLLSSYHPERALQPALLDWLRRRARRGQLMGCVDTGALLFARAGLLSRRPAAAHHEAIAAYRTAFSDEMFIDRMFDFAPERCSSAGGVATIDMTLALISHFTSPKLARRIAEILNYRRLETEQAQGSFGRDWSIARINRDLARAVEIMIANIDTTLSVASVADRANLPPWRMRRLFLKYLRMTPSAYYRRLRLDRARAMLRNSHAPVGEIAVRCGFDSHETFTRAYRRRFACAPSADREWGM